MRGASSTVDDSGAVHGRPGGDTVLAIGLGCVNQWGPCMYVDAYSGSFDLVWARASCSCK